MFYQKITYLLSFLIIISFSSCEDKKPRKRIKKKIQPKTEIQKTPEQIQVEKQRNQMKALLFGSGAKFEFKETIWDFGTITEGKKISKIFTFKNTGKKPLIIRDARGSCGCTTAQYDHKPIAPGSEGRITVFFDSSGRSNNQNKQVTITANTQPGKTILRLKGFVNNK